MKVLKFGGTSVGSVESILSLKQIVEKEAQQGTVIVVVSALGGITDKLIATSQMAKQGNELWEQEYEAIVKRHRQMIESIILDPLEKTRLYGKVNPLLEQLRSIFTGVFLIHDLSRKTLAAIVSYGERLSSHIVASLIEGGQRMNARDFIKTERKNGIQSLDADLTYQLVRKTFCPVSRNSVAAHSPVFVVPGFISKDRDSGETTNLGRGGSDYTASIIAAALDADVLEIWTDVDGFMTADPRVIHSAYTINELSYVEAMELCNFGAKVIYPPTIYPVCVKNIPIRVKILSTPNIPVRSSRTTSRTTRNPLRVSPPSAVLR